MTKEQIINKVVNDKSIKEYCRYVCKGADYHKDLYQYVIEYLCLMDEEKIIAINDGSIEWYVKATMYTNANNRNTPFWKEYLGGRNIIKVELSETLKDTSKEDAAYREWKDSLIDLIEDTLDDEASKTDEYAWEVGLFRSWMQNGCNGSKLSKKTGIPYMTIITQINDMKRKINENIDSYD